MKLNSLQIIKENKSKPIINKDLDNEKIICNHCKRTTTNGISCIGMCVADSEY